MNAPLVAVAIPTYSRKELLLRMIGSIPSGWKVFVSDNDSSLAPLERPLGENVFVSHAPSMVPMFANWNRALSLVDGDCTHVFIPSDDDIFLPNIFETVSEALARYPEADVFVFGCDFVDGEDRTWKGYCPDRLEALSAGEGFLRFFRGVDARMPGVLFRKAFLDRIGAFDERFQLTAADSDLVQRALLLGRSVFVPSVIGLYRIWPGSLTYAKQATDLWMKEIRLWTEKIGNLLQDEDRAALLHIDVGQYQDEIIAQNLLAGLNNLITRGERDNARAFLGRNRMPARATWRTRFRMLRCQWKLRGAAQ